MIPKTETDLEKDNKTRIADNIKYLLDERQNNGEKSRNGFVNFCKEKYNYDINEGNLSKRVNGQISFGPMLLAYMCEYLEVSMEQVCYERMTPAINIIKRSYDGGELLEKFTVKKENLDKYYGSYYCYFFPTIKEEKGVIQGKFDIEKLDDEPYAKVKLVLNIRNKEWGRKKHIIQKMYEGIMIISSKLSVCYCIISNAELGECNFITFRFNRALNTTDNQGGLAVVSTVSAGHEKVPTIHRMLISRKRLTKAMQKKLIPCLYLNRSDIVIEMNKLEEVIDAYDLSQEAKKTIKDNMKYRDLCVISESALKLAVEKEANGCSVWEVISGVRGKAYNVKYNKISEKADRNVINLLLQSERLR